MRHVHVDDGLLSIINERYLVESIFGSVSSFTDVNFNAMVRHKW